MTADPTRTGPRMRQRVQNRDSELQSPALPPVLFELPSLDSEERSFARIDPPQSPLNAAISPTEPSSDDETVQESESLLGESPLAERESLREESESPLSSVSAPPPITNGWGRKATVIMLLGLIGTAILVIHKHQSTTTPTADKAGPPAAPKESSDLTLPSIQLATTEKSSLTDLSAPTYPLPPLDLNVSQKPVAPTPADGLSDLNAPMDVMPEEIPEVAESVDPEASFEQARAALESDPKALAGLEPPITKPLEELAATTETMLDQGASESVASVSTLPGTPPTASNPIAQPTQPAEPAPLIVQPSAEPAPPTFDPNAISQPDYGQEELPDLSQATQQPSMSPGLSMHSGLPTNSDLSMNAPLTQGEGLTTHPVSTEINNSASSESATTVNSPFQFSTTPMGIPDWTKYFQYPTNQPSANSPSSGNNITP